MTYSANRRLTLSIATFAGLIAAVALGLSSIVPAQAQRQDRVGQPISAGLMQTLQLLSHDRLDYTGSPGRPALQAIKNPQAATTGKPLMLYMGADFCPYCAAVRWPLVITLMRFGQLDGLRYMRSSKSDVYANTITFDLHAVHYQSPYIKLQAVELEDRDQHLLQKPTDQQKALFEKFDTTPYTQYPGAIPFLYLDGRFLTVGSPISPALFKKLSWRQAADTLASSDGKLTQDVIGSANQYTAAICQLTKGQPAKVCQAPGVAAAAKQLPQPPAQ